MKISLKDLKWDERGLVPVVVQDARTDEVLTLAYVNAESLGRTLEEGETWFWSRSRAALWHKGETSGHTQHVVDLRLDCDADALLVRVEPRGPACHTGARSCFHQELAETSFKLDDNQAGSHSQTTVNQPAFQEDAGREELGRVLTELYELVETRRRERPEGSYTTYLFNEGLDKILKKVGEESAETIIAAKNADARPFVSEVSDLLYHLVVLLVERGATLEDLSAELSRRSGKRSNG